ncbi:MAG: hypothetical protein IKD36_02530 [Clostridia bacterium]|nr:hypothetical protein [Clostridia bacterium]
MDTNYGQVTDNRKKASNSKDFGVGKINQIMRKKENPDKSKVTDRQRAEEIEQCVIAAINSKNPSIADIFYAGIEAIKGCDPNGAFAEIITGLFNRLEEYNSGLSESNPQKQAIQENILDSEKMNGILFESLVSQGQYLDAGDILPKLQENSAKSSSVIQYHAFIVGEVAAAEQMDLLSPEEKKEYDDRIRGHINASIVFLEDKFKKTYDFQTGVELLRFKLTTNASMGDIAKLANLVLLTSKKFNMQEMTSTSKMADYIFVLKLSTDSRAKEILSSIKRDASLDMATKGDDDIITKSKAYREMEEPERAAFDEKRKTTYIEPEKQENGKEVVHPTPQEKAAAVMKGSYSYAGTLGNIEEATYVGGNLGYSGQVPDHCITKKDVQLFDSLLQVQMFKLFPLQDPAGSKDDPKNRIIPKGLEGFDVSRKLADLDFEKEMPVFMAAVDGMIRGRFNTTNFAGSKVSMEEQALLTESPYNDAFKSILAETGAFGLNVDGNSLTNIATLFMEGVGDCRHHAQVKQIMFDRWKDGKMNTALDVVQSGKGDVDAAMRSIDVMSRTELRTFDVCIYTNLEMEQGVGFNSKNGTMETWDSTYRPKRRDDDTFTLRTPVPKKDEKGEPVLDENGQQVMEDPMSKLEEHTMCMLVTRDEQGGLTSLRFADAFYQEPGKGSGDYDLSFASGVELAGAVQVDDKGKYRFNPGDIFCHENVGKTNGRDIKVSFGPTAYAGKRDYDLYGRFEHAQICGIDYGAEPTTDEMLGRIGETHQNHADRMKAATAYAYVRRCIVRNLIAKNLRESETLDISHNIRDAVEFDCKTKKVSEMDEAETKRLNIVCNDLSEMRSPKFCDIYYRVMDVLAGKGQELESLDETKMKIVIEQVCNECSEEYFKQNNLANPEENRRREIASRFKHIETAAGNLAVDEKTQTVLPETKKAFIDMATNYLRLSFPESVVQQFLIGVENGQEIDVQKFVENMRAMSQEKEKVAETSTVEAPAGPKLSVKEMVDQIMQDPTFFAKISTEDFANDPLKLLNTVMDSVSELEGIPGVVIDYATINAAIDAKRQEIDRAIQREEEAARAAANAQQAGIDAENAMREGEAALGVGV